MAKPKATEVVLYEATFKPVVRTVPARCPRCGADLSQERGVRLWEWSDGARRMRLDPASRTLVDEEADLLRGDLYRPEEVRCGSCHTRVDRARRVR